MGCRLLKMGRLRRARASVGKKRVRKTVVARSLKSKADDQEHGRKKANVETLRTQRFAEVLGRGESLPE
jgi:hypothetical protein